MKTSFTKRMLALLLVLCMVIPMLPTFTLPAKAATETPVVLIAGSDFQANSDEAGATIVKNILTTIKKDYPTADGFLFAGDYDVSYFDNVTESTNGLNALKDAVDGVYTGLGSGDNAIYVQGNHDPTSMVGDLLAANGANDPASGAYGVYTLHENMYSWYTDHSEQQAIDTAAGLKTYLDAKLEVNYTKPIFVVAHLPLHYTMRTSVDGDCAYANHIFDVLNDAAGKGLNIIYLFGHHHSNSWLDSQGGSAVYYAKGDKINIAQSSTTDYVAETLNFTYLNAGFVGYYSTTNTTAGVEKDLSMTVFEILGDTVQISRYTANGIHDLKSRGVANTARNEPFLVNTKVYSSPQTTRPTNAVTGNGATVYAEGVTGVDVTLIPGEIPGGYSAYLTYDITLRGYTQGTPARVVVPVDATFDQSKPVMVIDHASGTVHSTAIMDGTVSFETNHFSTYSIAQTGADPVVATGKLASYRATAVTSLTAGTSYVVRNYQTQKMLTSNVRTSTSKPTKALEMKDIPAADGTLWYYDGTYLRLKSDASTGYIMISDGMGYLDSIDSSVNADYDRAASEIFLNDDGQTFTIKRGGNVWYLNAYGGSSSINAAGYTQDGNANPGSKWYFYTLSDADITLTATPTLSAITTSQIADISTTVEVDDVETDDYVISWSSSDESIATVDSNGRVTAIRPGRVTIIAAVTHVNGRSVLQHKQAIAKIPIHVYEVSKTEVSATVKGQFLDAALGDAVTLTPGTASGPYAIVHYTGTYLFLSGRTIASGDTGYKGYNSVTGLQVSKNVDPNHFWYYDGTYMRYGAPDGPYLAYVNNVVTLSDNESDAFDAVVEYGDNGSGAMQYNFSEGTASNKYLNVHGGAGSYNVVTLYSSAYHSRWYIQNVAAPELEMDVLPAAPVMTVGESQKINTSVRADGQVELDYTISWSVADSAVATISADGTLTAVAPGNTTVTCKLTSVYGKSNLSDMTVKIPVTVTAGQTSYVTASGTTLPSHAKITNLTAGTASGPYVIIHSDTKWLLTHDVLYTDSENYNGYNSNEGISIMPVDELADPPLWYYDGTTLKAGYSGGKANYLIYDSTDNMVKLGTADMGSSFDMIERGGSGGSATHYWIGTSGIPTPEDQTDPLKVLRYLNALGGGSYNVIGPWQYHRDNGAEANGSKWYLHQYTPSQPVTLMVSPAKDMVSVGKTTTLTPAVALNGVHTDSYTITWASTDTSVATVSNGVVTGVDAGRASIIATLIKAGGKETLMSVEIPISVAQMNGNTAVTTLGPALVKADPLSDGAGGPYLITNVATNHVLTNIQQYQAKTTSGTIKATGLWVKEWTTEDFTDLWYYDGHDLIYGHPDAADRHMVYENSIVGLGNNPSAAMGPLVAATKAERLGMFSISAPDSRSLNQLGGSDYDAVAPYGVNADGDLGSAWYFYSLTGERDVVLTVTPESSEIQISETTQLNASLKSNGVEQTDDYLLSWTSLNPEVAEVTADGQVIPIGHGETQIKVTLRKLNGERVDDDFYAIVNVKVSNIASATIDNKTATTNQHTPSSVELGPTMTIQYKDGTTKTVKLTTDHLRYADGTRFNANTAGTHEYLQVVYGGFTVCTDFTLEVVGLPDYPEYPNEGSVLIDKEAMNTVNFQSSGLAEVELRVSGIPADKGVDVIIMLDTSSSMNNTELGERRIDVLCKSLNNLIAAFQTKNEDGTDKDIKVAIGEFNRYYWNAADQTHVQHSTYVDEKDTLSDLYMPFTGTSYVPAVFTGSKTLDVGALVPASSLGTNPCYTEKYTPDVSEKSIYLNTHSGTNYDYAFDAVYQMADAVNTHNAENGEERELYVIFMSDGAPFQYNYFYNGSENGYWNNWLNGEMVPELFGEDSNREYYNEEGKHWMAEAIKGKRTEKYKVIRKNDPRDVNGDGIFYINGLGATMYSIGFCMMPDNNIRLSTINSLIDKMGSTSNHVYHTQTASDLDNAFTEIAGDILNAVSNAAFVDTMGPEYDLKLGNHTYTHNNNSVTFTDNAIRVRQYEIWTYAEYELGLCTIDKVGTRKGDAPAILETVTFNADGTEAYSSVIGSGVNILNNGVISASTFWYNANTSDVEITLDSGKAYTLPAETFYWKVGSIDTKELALSYYVYLTGTMEGTRESGIYDTNTDATLYYENYLGNDCQLVAPIPDMSWGGGQVSYGFYLVDKAGVPINGNGQTSFLLSTRVGSVTKESFKLNSDGKSLVAKKLVYDLTLQGYRLFDNGARYDVTLDSDGYGTIRVFSDENVLDADGNPILTTYITGLSDTPVLYGDSTGTSKSVTDYANANTTVWFAVTVADDGLVVDKTVEGEGSEFTLTLDAYANGSFVEVPSDKPSDIVLVLDQSSTMYTPAGVNADRIYAKKADYPSTAAYNSAQSELAAMKTNGTAYSGAAFSQLVQQGLAEEAAGGTSQFLEDAKHLGYWIAIHNSYEYMYIVQYAQNSAGNWGWYYVCVDQTTRSVKVDTANPTGSSDTALAAKYGTVIYNNNGKCDLLTNVTYYKSQYGALYDSLREFVGELHEESVRTGADHRVAVVGFSSPFYDGWDYYDGTGLYIDGDYFLYDTDYKYTYNGTTYDPDKSHGSSGDPVYNSSTVMTSAEKNKYDGYGIAGKYGDALVSVKDDAGLASVLNSVDAYTANYQQTCPSIGILMAETIFDARINADATINPGISVADKSFTGSASTGYSYTADVDAEHMSSTYTGDNVEDRDEIIVLFTDGVPTVRCCTDRDLGFSKDKCISGEFWDITAGVDDAIDHAHEAKDKGIRIYTVGTSRNVLNMNLPTTSDAGTDSNAPLFLDYVSSDYPDATASLSVTPIVDTAKDEVTGSTVVTTVNTGVADDRGYASYASDEGISVSFSTIYESIVETVSLDDTAVLKEVLSDYFQLDGMTEEELLNNISVYTADYLGVDENGNDLFSDELVPYTEAEVQIVKGESGRFDTICVSNFDYGAEYVSITNSKPRGRKLVVKVNVEVRDGFWGGNNVPTNDSSTAIYTPEGEPFIEFPVPEANVPVKPQITAKDQTVYYGEDNLNAPDDLVDKITVGGEEVTYEDGKFQPKEDWMDDFADLSWNEDLFNPADPDATVSGTKGQDYTFGIVITPKPNQNGQSNSKYDGDNYIAGTPVVSDGIESDSATGRVDVLVPVISFEDATIDLGDKTDDDYYESTNRQPTIQWVNQEDPYGKNGLPTDPSDKFNTVPDLSFTYTPDSTEDDYFTQDTPVNVEVHLGSEPTDDNKITNEVYFDWVHCDSNLHDDSETIVDDLTGDTIHRHKGDVSSNEFYIHLMYVLNNDTVVIDFGLPVDIDATFNDVLPAGAKIVGIKLGGDLSAPFTTTADSGFANKAAATHGTLTLQTDGKLRYVPSGMKMNVSEVFQYEIRYTTTETNAQGQSVSVTRYYHSTVTVIPATIIYYEDSFLKFYTETRQEDGSFEVTEGGWTTAGSDANVDQKQDRPDIGNIEIDANQIYGYDANYGSMAEYSYGSAQMINVKDGKSGIANFSFRGTGFDVVSLSSDDTGVIIVEITDADGNQVANYAVDSYYGYAVNYYRVTYTYTETGWTKVQETITRAEMGTSEKQPENPTVGDQFVTYVTKLEPNTSASATLYQVPVIKVDLNEVVKTEDDPETTDVDETEYYGYGEYNVEIYVAYSWFFDHGQCDCSTSCTGCFDFYLDAIRIYNPANDGEDDAVIKDAYITDHEYKPTFEELRNHLITAGQFDALGNDDDISGVIFIDTNTALTDGNASGVPGSMDDTVGMSAIADYTNYGPNNELYLAAGQAVAFTLKDETDIDRVHLALKSVGGSAQVDVYGVDGSNTTQVLKDFAVNTATDLYYDISALIGKTVVIRNSGTAGILSITNLKTTWKAEAANSVSVFSINRSAVALVLSSINESAPAPVVPEIGSDALAPAYATVTFEDEVKMNIYFKLNNEALTDAELGLVTADETVDEITLDNAQRVYTEATFDADSGLYRVTTDGIAARNLADALNFRVYARLADGTVVYSKQLAYSPKQYADTVIGNDAYPETLQNLTVSMLNYGAQAQIYFSYRTEELMNAHLTEEQQTVNYSSDLFKGVVQPEADKLGAFVATTGFTTKYPTVSFEGAFNLSYYFGTSTAPDAAPVLYYWTAFDYANAEVLTADNASGVLTMEGEGLYSATVPGVAPKDMNSTIYVAAVYQAQGNTFCSGVLPYSLGTYFAAQAQADGTAIQPLAKAAAVYGNCAEAYFG